MSKGYSIEELRIQLDTDAQHRAKIQEKTIKDLLSDVTKYKEFIVEQKRIEYFLSHRCYVVSNGKFCFDCKRNAKCEEVRNNDLGEVL